MEFANRNFVTSNNQITVYSNTASSENLLNWNRRYQYSTSGFADDNTSTNILITFDSTQTINRIALLEHNLKNFSIYYNGTTTNQIAFTSGATTTASFSSNSETSQYFYCTSFNATSVTLKMNSTITPNQNKALGYFLLSSSYLDFDRIPNSGGYTPKITPTQVIHKMSDGGVRSHKIEDKYAIDLNFSNITESFRNSLKDIYETNDSFVFVPFGTSTAWDGIILDAVWDNGFDFYKYSDESVQSGFRGRISLKERS